MKPLKMLHRGFDKLEIAIKGALAPDDIEILEAARAKAEKSHSPALVSIGPGDVDMHIAESGLRGGYAFRGDTGPMGELWFFKRGLSRDDWNIRVSIKALALATIGWKQVYIRLLKTLKRLGVTAAEMRVGRVDYAIDYQMPLEFRLDPGCFISHSRSSRSEHSKVPPLLAAGNPHELLTHFACREVTSVTIGKMPGHQTIAYNKLYEVIIKKNREWPLIWGVDLTDKSLAVFRVELRAGKRHLKSWNARDFLALERRLGTTFDKMIRSVRHVVPSEAEKNVTRWPLSRFWKCVCKMSGRGWLKALTDQAAAGS